MALTRVAVHADHVEERLGVFVVTVERAGGGCDARAGEVGLTAHEGADGASIITAPVAVVRDSERHQQRAQVGEAEAERTIIVRVLRDLVGGIRGVVNQDFLRD